MADEHPHRPRNLSSEYLDDALEAFSDLRSPTALYGSAGPLGEHLGEQAEYRAMLAAAGNYKRTRLCRHVVLFTAFAAEAYVNEYLAVHMRGKPKADREALDRLTTVNKYVLGTRIATGEDQFPRHGTAAVRLKELFKLRDRLVHPKPGKEAGYGEGLHPDFAPPVISHYMVVVAFLGLVLVRGAYGPKVRDWTAELIWFGRDVMNMHAQEAMNLPDLEAEDPHGPLIGRILIYLNEIGEDRSSTPDDVGDWPEPHIPPP